MSIRRLVPAVVAGLTLLVGCGTETDAPPSGDEQPVAVVEQQATPTVTWNVDGGATVKAGFRLETTVTDGTAAVEIVDEDGRRYDAESSRAGTSWTSEPLPPGHRFTATAQVLGGRPVTRSFATKPAARALRTSISPLNGTTVGVGHPIVVTFNHPVSDRAAAERALTVSTSKPVGEAGWYWFSDTEVQYRPRDYWPAGTKVTLRVALDGVQTGDVTWGDEERTIAFTIGRSQVLRINDDTHQMTVTRNGSVLRKIPVSLGKDGFTTRSGTKVIMTREKSRRMDSDTVGIEGSEAYDLDVPYAMRLTDSGEFIHGAPWSEWAQGKQNVSHGCTNIPLDDARWLMKRSLVGDPVETTGTGRSTEPDNGLGGGWNISWSQWAAGSALG